MNTTLKAIEMKAAERLLLKAHREALALDRHQAVERALKLMAEQLTAARPADLVLHEMVRRHGLSLREAILNAAEDESGESAL